MLRLRQLAGAVGGSRLSLRALLPTATRRSLRSPRAPLVAAHSSVASARPHVLFPLAIRSFSSTPPLSSPSSTPSNSPDSPFATSSSPPALSLAVGSVHHGFTVQSITPVPDFNLTVYHLTHPSGATFYHLSRDDEDACFSVTFRTPPTSSSGIAHILEHTTLCGSTRYPVRDPFFLLNRRSLKTYMNAMTAQDYTLYPFSTTHATDYRNLLSVYLDSTFFPLLRPHDFQQEGHRLEFDPATDRLTIKGVVYNEMKGAMSDASQLFTQRLQSAVFEDTGNLYHYNSGGEPSDIPELTHEQLKAFHARYYTPSNACFYSYGRMEPPLALVDELVLSKLAGKAGVARGEGEAVLTYHPQTPPTAPVTRRLTCPPDPLTPNPLKQTKVATSWLLHSLSSLSPSDYSLTSFSLSLLSSLLLDGPSAPLYQALIEPNLGNGYAPGTGYDGDSRQPTFTIGLQGIADADIPTLTSTIERVLTERASVGFEAERVEAILHQVEVGIKHVGSHFGMGVMMRMMNHWAHEQNPIEPLLINKKVEHIRQQMLTNPTFFQHLITTHLLRNQARTTLIMSPDEEYARKENDKEAERVRSIEQQLTEEQRQRIREEAVQLKEQQDTVSDPTILPSLSVSDIKTEAEHVNLQPLDVPTAAAAMLASPPPASAPLSASTSFSQLTAPVITSTSFPPVVFLEAATNGCAYIRLLFNFQALPSHLRPYFPLFTSFLTDIGAGPYDYRQLSHLLDLHTGGIGASLRVFAHRDDLLQHEELLLMRGMSLTRNVHHLLDLLRYVLLEPRWTETERVKQLLIQTAAGLSSSMQDSGHSYAKTSAAATLTPATFVNEEMGGITFVMRVNELVQRLEGEEEDVVLKQVCERLMEISQLMLQQGMLRVMIVGDRDALHALEEHLPSFLHSTSPTQAANAASTPLLTSFTPTLSRRTFFALPIQVHHASLIIPTLPHQHPHTAPLTVSSKLQSSIFLHKEIREKGGAYGGGSSHGDGLFSYYSYRDPNSLQTVDAFRRSIEWVKGGGFEESDVEEALLSLFSGIDAPTPPSSKGLNQFITGVTTEERQQYRERLLAVKKADVIQVSEQYLAAGQATANVCIVGDETKVPADVQSGADGWMVERVDLSSYSADESEGEEEGEAAGMDNEDGFKTAA